MLTQTITPDLPFGQAASLYMQLRSTASLPGASSARYIRPNTATSYEQYIRSLGLFFGSMRLCDIRWFHLRAYQQARVNGDEPFIRKRRPHDKELQPCPAKPNKVNQELRILTHLLRKAACWTPELEEMYEPLLDDQGEVARALTPEDQQLWLDTCRADPRWHVVHCYCLLAFGTCMSTDELRGIRIGDINLHQGVVTVARRSSKNRYRARTIELVGGDVMWAAEQLLERARNLGSRSMQDFLFPFRVRRGHWDPARPMGVSGLKAQWEDIRAVTGLQGFRPYDCRHTAITRLAEAGVPIDIIMARAGHVSEMMRRHYTHVSQGAQRKWLEHASRAQQGMPRSAKTAHYWPEVGSNPLCNR